MAAQQHVTDPETENNEFIKTICLWVKCENRLKITTSEVTFTRDTKVYINARELLNIALTAGLVAWKQIIIMI